MKTLILARHPDYDMMIPEWELVRAVYDGETAVKAGGEAYLPMPEGFRNHPSVTATLYQGYMARASVPDLLAPTVVGLNGIMHAQDPEIELGPLESIREDATPDGLTITGLLQRITQEATITGRVALVPEIADDGTPRILIYSAENVLNWRTERTGSGARALSLLTLRERVPSDPKEDPAFEAGEDDRFLVYRLRDGVVSAQYYLPDPDGTPFAVVPSDEEIFPERGRGMGNLGRIPAVIVGAQDVTPDVDMVPLLGQARLALRIYRQDADYQWALHGTSAPTLVISGVDRGGSARRDDEAGGAEIELGAGAVIELEAADAKAYYLEFSGPGIAAQRESIRDDFQRALSIGINALESASRQVESGEAIGLRMKARTATASSIAISAAHGLERALRTLAYWQGYDDAEASRITVSPNLDFQRVGVDPQIVSAVVEAWKEGGVPDEVMFEAFRRSGLTDLDNEAFRTGAYRVASGLSLPTGP